MLTVKGHDNLIELCFEKGTTQKQAIEELREKKDFFENSSLEISYSGIELSYNDEMRFQKELREIFGDKMIFRKKKKLSKAQIEYSLNESERITTVVERSLRSGEVIESRGDIVVYGDVNPGALLKAQGNITVIGALRGTAHISDNGRVYAVYMQPAQIKIGKVCSYNKKSENVGSAVALAENGEIILQCL